MSEKSEREFDAKWYIPEKYRIDALKRTPKMEELLRACDEQQEKWREQFASPFLATDPKTRERARALITIDEYQAYGVDVLTGDQLRELAEAYAATGRFDMAAEFAGLVKDKDLRDRYEALWQAVWREDAEWCACDASRQFASEEIYSIKHSEVRPVLKCGQCGEVNVAEMPERLVQARKTRAAHRERFSGMHPQEVKEALRSR